MDVKTETERLRQKNYEAAARAYRNISAALNDRRDHDGINAVLRFLNERGRVDAELPLSEQLRYIEEAYHIKTRYAELDGNWYQTAAVPMLVKTTGGCWKAVIPHVDGSCSFIDGGKKKRVTAKTARQFTGDAMCFYKGFKGGRVTSRDLLLFMLNSVSAQDKAAVAVVSVLSVLAGMAVPWVNQFIFSQVVPAGDLSGIGAACALVFSGISAAALLRLLQSLILTNSLLRTSVYVQSGIFSRLLALKPAFFQRIKAGELSRMILEFSDISQIVSVRSVSACIGILLSLAYLVQIRMYAPGLLGWVIMISALTWGAMALEGALRTRWQREYQKSLSKMSGFCYEMFSGIEQIKLNGAAARVMGRWSSRYLDAAGKEDKPPFLKYSGAVYKLVHTLGTAAIFLSGANMAASSYIAFAAAYGAYTGALLGAGEIIRAVSMFRAACLLMKPVLDEECEEYSGKKRVDSLTGEITVSNLFFRYSQDSPYVINGLSAKISPGESVGIIGASGCGKSTLLRLLLGFEQAEKGSIYIDGYDLRELDLKSYRQRVGTVLQNSGLIAGDLYSNITITKPGAGMDEVRSAIALAELSDDIAALPMGLHTPVSPENCTLSGGQRQRILIARALLHQPSVLIFDEATSALDNITQAKITSSLNKLSCTKIIVAHRLSTIETCDRILVMDRGGIVEEGTFDRLMRMDGALRRLMKNQDIGQPLSEQTEKERM